MIGLKRGTVTLAKHHGEWAAAFEAEKANLEQLAGDVALDIQHLAAPLFQAWRRSPSSIS